MSIWTSLEPASATVDPGSSSTVRLRLRNTGDVVDEYRFVPVGDIAPYATVEPATVRLYPGSTETVELTFSPPRTPDSTAGPNPYGVQIIPTERSEATTVVEGNLTIIPFTEVRAELVPHTVKGRFRGRPKLAVDNLGNTRLTASVVGGDNGDELSYEITPASVQIEPGRAAFVDATLKPRQITWAGQKQRRPYELTLRRSGSDPLKVEGTYVQRGVLPYWMMTTLSLMLALTVAGLVLWFSHQPQVRSLAQEKIQEAGATALPDEPEQLPAPEPAKTAEEEPADETGDGSGGGGGGGGGGGDSGEKAPSGPLPIRPGNEPNLLVQFAQVRLSTDRGDCKPGPDYTVGVLDTTTVAALKCFQRANDERTGSTLAKTDGPGNLGRSTMTALLMEHFGGRSSVSLKPGESSPEVPWVWNIIIWTTNSQYDQGDLETITKYTALNLEYLKGKQSKQTAGPSLPKGVKLYQQAVGIPQTGQIDEATTSALKAGKVKNQDKPGTVTAVTWPPAPVE
ncbi:hypothetical protein [Streptomyces sp. NBC_01794]|uniref:COG1470 family protein n=1 Tax=Streptomyces sp. NBC_01794 TaxID=2975942 RepID=UPI003086B599|nr:hypothetical protein OIE54_10555 [Streptomyces sp. NBC_01794]